MRTFPCHYLKGEVELSDEREAHIADSHPDLLPEFLLQVGLTLAAPDEVRRSLRLSSARIFCREFEEVCHGKYVVVVVVSETTMTRRLANGETEWRKI